LKCTFKKKNSEKLQKFSNKMKKFYSYIIINNNINLKKSHIQLTYYLGHHIMALLGYKRLESVFFLISYYHNMGNLGQFWGSF